MNPWLLIFALACYLVGVTCLIRYASRDIRQPINLVITLVMFAACGVLTFMALP